MSESMDVNAMTDTDDIILQDEEQGPGWFLKISYLIITIFCLYYLFTNWNWQSDYELHQLESNKADSAVLR